MKNRMENERRDGRQTNNRINFKSTKKLSTDGMLEVDVPTPQQPPNKQHG